jgi:2,3-bisphosphoglycerate-dependent phosphoglycerate mutase
LPYFNAEILPRLTQGENILVAAHGNSLRSLVMQLDNLSKEEVIELEIPTGAPIIYTFSGNESPTSKENLFG